ncbi:MAG: hypothetical protein K2P95_06895 [Hyphomonadaceae bacterium]|nr:hypothetical protein [Hyphomonadaceae bacterium]
MRSQAIMGAAVAVLALSACKGPSVTVTDPESGEKAKVSLDGGGEDATLKISGQDGTAVIAGAGASLPKDLPGFVAVYPSLKLQSVMSGVSAEGNGGMLIGVTPDSVEKVAAFYRAQLEREGFSSSRIEMQNEGAVTLGGARGEDSLFVAVTPADGETGITITYRAK